MKPDMLEKIGRGLEAVSQALGSATFEQRLADFLGQMIPHDMMTIARYSVVGPPEFLAHTANYPSELVQRYLELYHLFDPYASYWSETRKPGPVFLRDLSSGQRKVGRYIREFLPESGIIDEMGIFLPPLAGSSLAFFFENVGRRFAKSERALLDALFPLAANLYKAHLAVLFSTSPTDQTASPAADQPMLITDEAGRSLWATTSWAALSASTRAQIEALARHGADRTLQIRSLDDGNTLLTEPLPAGTGGEMQLLWVVRARDKLATHADPLVAGMQVFDSALTPREREIVELVLKGYPTSLIAEKLALSRGTVKNHRRRIYHKLDITTERELFLMFLDAALGTAPAAES